MHTKTFNHRKKMRLAAAAWSLCATVLTATAIAADGPDQGGAYTSKLQLGTANPGGGYYTMGSEYANIFEKRIDSPDLRVSAIQTSGSVDNLAKISRGEIELGLAQATTAKLVLSGEGKYKNVNTEPVGLLGCLEPYALHAFTLADTGIRSIGDLKGKRVAIGAPGSANQLASKALMSAYGLSDGDYQAFSEASDSARQRLRDGNLDAIFEVQPVPFPGLQELESAKGGVRLLSIEPQQLQSLLAHSDFSPYTIAAGSYGFAKEPVKTVSDWSCLFASKAKVSPDLAYELTRTLYEHAGDLTLPAKQAIDVNTAIPPNLNLPLHPGAERYFKDKGIIKD